MVELRVRLLEVQLKPSTPGGRLSGLLRTWAVCLERIHHHSARLRLTPAARLALPAIRAWCPFSPLGFSGSSLRRL